MRTHPPPHPYGPKVPRARRDVTDALLALRPVPEGQPDGASDALGRLVPMVYGELRRIAHRQLRAERPGHTLSTTGLVHEAYLKLADSERLRWRDREHFLAIAARAMRHILVDYARQHGAAKRAGAYARVSLGDALLGDGADGDALAAADRSASELVALDDALARLAELDPRLTRVVEMRFFGGMAESEIAAVLGVNVRTVRRDWAKARAWLHRALRA